MIFESNVTFNGESYKACKFGKNVKVEAGVTFDVIGGIIGDGTIIRSGARIEGNSVVLGRESYIDHGAVIGGGSCFDEGAFLNAGMWLHMGWNSQINIARGVEIGDECGIGIETKLFTHGAYLPADFGFPCQWGPIKIGHRVWLPNAWVNPGVTIGCDVVVGARSLVHRDLPGGCLAAGIPVKILKEGAYPGPSRLDEVLAQLKGITVKEANNSVYVISDKTLFDIRGRVIDGPVTNHSEYVKNQFRRNGIRFPYVPSSDDILDAVYRHWDEVYG
jgi:acetyltransferase-like isoleucine patch superfamily enzyme